MDAVVCGIDPGLGTTGYAVLAVDDDGLTVRDAGVCRLDARQPLAERLVALERDITAVLEEHRPSRVGIEQLYVHYKHPRTAILMGHARGVILLAAGRLGIETFSYAATEVKRHLTGNGRATKSQVQRAVQASLSLPVLPEPDDVADALAIAMRCATDARREAAAKVAP